jgi:hypothetical protein
VRAAADVVLDQSGQPKDVLASTGYVGIMNGAAYDIDPSLFGQSGNPSADTLRKSLAFVTGNLDPHGKLIVYGNSAGGDTALNLCRGLGSYWTFFDVGGSLTAQDPDVSMSVCGRLVVDLLVTVDAAKGPLSAFVDRSVPVSVRRNVNDFQTTALANEEFSYGAANVAVNTTPTTVEEP